MCGFSFTKYTISIEIQKLKEANQYDGADELNKPLESEREKANQEALGAVRSLGLPFSLVYNTTAAQPFGVVDSSYKGHVYVYGYDDKGEPVDVVLSNGKFVGWYENFQIVSRRATT